MTSPLPPHSAFSRNRASGSSRSGSSGSSHGCASGLTRRALAAGGITALGGIAAACANEDSSGTDDPAETGNNNGDQNVGVDPNPDYQRPRITRLATLTGPDITTQYKVGATDLGIPTLTPDGRGLMIFGDTFEEPVVGGGFWRSPVGLFFDPKVPLDQGLTWIGAVGGETAEQLVEYEHGGEVSTILPADVITIGETIYLWVMRNRSLGNVTGTEIWTSKDSGETWDRSTGLFPADHLDGHAQQCTWVEHPSDGFVYALTTGFQRDKGVILQRVPKESILEPAAYEVYGLGGWGTEGHREIVRGQIGEMCLRVIDDKFVLTFFNAGMYRADCFIADSPEQLVEPLFADTLFWGCDWGREDHERVAQLYGPYILPGSTLYDMHIALSQWRTGPDWPYHVQQFRVQGLGQALEASGGE